MAFSGNEIHHVLLVDHDSNHASVVDMLHYFNYKVTSAKLASTALSILSNGKVAFDMVIANINSPDFYGFKLLQEAVKMGLLVMLILDNDNATTATKGLEEGAFLCVTKPISMEILKYLWQHVLREKINKLKSNKRFGHVMGFVDEAQPSRVKENNNSNWQNAARSGEISANQDEYSDVEDDPNNFGYMKRKIWTEWTEELHEKFVDAVITLGEGRCYPREILDLMNVPGLTRMQVASHLQKCRGGFWLPPHERKYKAGSPGSSYFSPEARAPRTKTRRFGSMPVILANPQNHQNMRENQEKHCALDEELNVNSSVGDNNSNTSSDADGYRPQIQPQNAANGYNDYAYGYHLENNAAAVDMWNLGLGLCMEDPYMFGEHFSYGDQVAVGHGVGFINGSMPHHMNISHEDTLELRNDDFMVQNSTTSPQGVGLNYDETMHALDLEQLYSMQMPVVPDARNGQWDIREDSGSGNCNEKNPGLEEKGE